MLEKLSLRRCAGSINNDVAALYLANGLRNNKRLATLDLRDIPDVSVSAWNNIFNALQSPNCRLKELDLQRCKLNDATLKALAGALSANRSLMSLNISENRFTVEGWEAFSVALQSPNLALNELNLSSTNLTSEAIIILQSSLANNRNLRSMKLSSYPTTSAWWTTLATVVRSPNCILEKLDLPNSMDDEAVRVLSNVIPETNSLRELTVRVQRQVATVGWQRLSTAVQNSSLVKLDLHGSTINSDTMIVLANALVSNTKLKELIVSHSDMASNCWGVLARMLCDSSSNTAIFNSNHTLQKMVKWDWETDSVPKDIRKLLRTNRENSQSQAARLKIIDNHFQDGFFVEPFVDMEMAVLSHALSWMGNDRAEVNEHFFLFLRNTPTLFVGWQSKKRKRV